MTNLGTLRNALQAFDTNQLTPYAVGFDRTFNRLWDYAAHQSESTGFPPYNIVKMVITNTPLNLPLQAMVKMIFLWKLQKVLSLLNLSKIQIVKMIIQFIVELLNDSSLENSLFQMISKLKMVL